MTEAELRALARVAFGCPRSPERLPQWLSDLAMLPPPSFHAHDSVMHAGLIAFDGYWYVTDVGWKELAKWTPMGDTGAHEPERHGDARR